jgi:hypothetical protein
MKSLANGETVKLSWFWNLQNQNVQSQNHQSIGSKEAKKIVARRMPRYIPGTKVKKNGEISKLISFRSTTILHRNYLNTQIPRAIGGVFVVTINYMKSKIFPHVIIWLLTIIISLILSLLFQLGRL